MQLLPKSIKKAPHIIYSFAPLLAVYLEACTTITSKYYAEIVDLECIRIRSSGYLKHTFKIKSTKHQPLWSRIILWRKILMDKVSFYYVKIKKVKPPIYRANIQTKHKSHSCFTKMVSQQCHHKVEIKSLSINLSYRLKLHNIIWTLFYSYRTIIRLESILLFLKTYLSDWAYDLSRAFGSFPIKCMHSLHLSIGIFKSWISNT